MLMIIFPLFLEIRLRLYGSSCTKFGFKDSDVNIDIQYPPHVSSSFDSVNTVLISFSKKQSHPSQKHITFKAMQPAHSIHNLQALVLKFVLLHASKVILWMLFF